MIVLFLLYFALGYWATGKVLYANKVVFYSGTTFFFRKLVYGALFGWILIPIALLKSLFGR